MILLRWPPVSVRLLYSSFLETGGPHVGYSFFSGSCSINTECASDPTRHLTAVHPVRPDTGHVRRVRDLEWRYCAWYAAFVRVSCIGLIDVFQATSRTTCPHFTYHSCITLSHLQRSWAGQRWPVEIVDGKCWRMTSGIEYVATEGVSSLYMHV
jgi:hypothetical protein